MYNVQEVVPQVYWVGGDDWKLEKFENIIPLPNGISYNSYIIIDEKTVLLDTSDAEITNQFLENVSFVLGDRGLDYLVVNHMEPDHSANIGEIVRRYPDVRVIGNANTFKFYDQFYDIDITKNRLEVKEGQELSIGQRTLRFYMAPMVHWPEVMLTYEVTQGILFSADAFGSFGAVTGNLFVDEVDYTDYIGEMRRYYSNIIGRFGVPVQSALKKVSGLQLNLICPLHGLVWRNSYIPYILNLYDVWSRYVPEQTGVVMFYTTMHGNTQNAMEILASKLSQLGVSDIHMYDIAKTDSSYIISDIWKYSNMVIGAPTYNMHLQSNMYSILRELSYKGLTNRKVTLVGNHTWMSAAISDMQGILSKMKGVEIIGTPLDILSSVKPGDEPLLAALADAVLSSMQGGTQH